MRRGLNSRAYTIVEVMIFLAVTGALLASTMSMISGQQRRTQFNQSIHDIQSQIDDVINNVATGYYARKEDFVCEQIPDGSYYFRDYDHMDPGNNELLGRNRGCIYIGRAIQFGVGGNKENFNIYNLIGKQYSNVSKNIDVQNIVEADPKAMAYSVADGMPLSMDNVENKTLKYGLQVYSITYNYNNLVAPTGVVAFVTDFARQTGTGGLTNGSRQARLHVINNTTLDNTKDDVVSKINATAADNFIPKSPDETISDVTICFNSNGSNQSGKITIGSNNRQLTTKLDIYEGANCSS